MAEIKLTQEMADKIVSEVQDSLDEWKLLTIQDAIGTSKLKLAILYLEITNTQLEEIKEQTYKYRIYNLSEQHLEKINNILEIPTPNHDKHQASAPPNYNPYLGHPPPKTVTDKPAYFSKSPKISSSNLPSNSVNNHTANSHILEAMSKAIGSLGWGWEYLDKSTKLEKIKTRYHQSHNKDDIIEFIKAAAQPRGYIFKNDYADTKSLKNFFHSIQKSPKAKKFVQDSIDASDNDMQNFQRFSAFVRQKFALEQPSIKGPTF